MERLARSQVAKGLFLLVLLLVVPFVSSSLRSSYLYILFNILIVALCLEAGFLKAISRHHDEKMSYDNATGLPMAREAIGRCATDDVARKVVRQHQGAKLARKPTVPKASMVTPRARALKRCSSRPSLFFIGGFEGSEKSGHSTKQEEGEEKKEKVEIEIIGEISKQELFTKAEAFIGNFYMQLKMQREESWKKIHEFYNKTF